MKANITTTQCAKIGTLDPYIKRRMDNLDRYINLIIEHYGYIDEIEDMYVIQEIIAREIPVPQQRSVCDG